MSSSSTSRVDLERLRSVYERSREAIAESPDFTMRAVAHLERDMHLIGRVGRFTIESDEPVERGGGDQAPAPLHYFLAGIGFCLLAQVAKFAPIYDVPLEDVSVDVRGEFSAAGKYDLSDESGAFRRVTVYLDVRSDAPSESVRKLVEHAERGCHAAQTVRNAVPVELALALNGDRIAATAPA